MTLPYKTTMPIPEAETPQGSISKRKTSHTTQTQSSYAENDAIEAALLLGEMVAALEVIAAERPGDLSGAIARQALAKYESWVKQTH